MVVVPSPRTVLSVSCTGLLGALLGCVTLAAPQPALAQVPRAGIAAMDEIVVTAQRREESIQDVGISITAFRGDDLLAQGVDSVVGLEDFAVNLEVEEQFGNGVPSYNIRGVGFVDFFANNAPTVGIYVDDVSFPLPIMTQGLLFDVSRVEVLRGPQGTLYGRNTTGGAVKVISNRPTEALRAGVTAEAGRFGLVEVEGFLSGQVADGIRARVSGRTSQGGDWQINRETGQELGQQDQFAGRMIVEFDITERIMFTLNANGFVDESDQLGLQLFQPTGVGNFPPHEGQRSTSFGASQEFADLVGIETTTEPFRDTEGWGINGTLDADLGFAELTYIGAFNDLDRTEYADWDAAPNGIAGVFFDTEAEVMSHEVRLVGEYEAVNWVAGLFYAEEDLDELFQSDFVASFGPGFAVFTPSAQEVETIGVYAHADYAISERVNLIGGIRFEDEDRDLLRIGTFATGFGPFNFANGTVDGTLESRSTSFSEVTGKAAIEYRPLENYMVYASFSRGIKSGGFQTANTLNPAAVDPFKFEELFAYEIGLKSDPIPGLLRFNAAAFYYDYNDQQVQSAIFDPATGAVVGRIVNAPETRIFGFELDAQLNLTENFQLRSAIGFKDGEFREFDDLDIDATLAAGEEVLIDRSGQGIGIPNLTYNGMATYSQPVFSNLELTGIVDWQYRDNVIRPLLGPVFEVDDYWVANAQAGIGAADGSWRVTMWGRNITNTDYDETRNFFDPNASVAAPKPPATYGVRVDLRY